MAIKVYGESDDLCIIDGAPYPNDEVGCFESDCVVELSDDTVIRVSYGENGTWEIEVLRVGQLPYELEKCPKDDDNDYSDVFVSKADYKQHCVVDRGENVVVEQKLTKKCEIPAAKAVTNIEIFNKVHNNGEKLTVRLTSNGQFCWVEGPDAGMIADLISIEPEMDYDEMSYKIVCDFSPYRNYNEKIAKTDWFWPGTETTGASWFSSGQYPENGCLAGYISLDLENNPDTPNDCFELVKNPENYRRKEFEVTEEMEELFAYTAKCIAQEQKSLLSKNTVSTSNLNMIISAISNVLPCLSETTQKSIRKVLEGENT